MPPNDYKKDEGKPPVLEAIEPFYPALLGLARMMEAMAVKHRLEGAKDPFSEWKQLPEAKRRLKRAFGSHALQGLFKVNTADGTHLHGYHALFNLLGALTIHEEDNAASCCGAADAATWQPPNLNATCVCGHVRAIHTPGHGGRGKCLASELNGGCLCPVFREE